MLAYASACHTTDRLSQADNAHSLGTSLISYVNNNISAEFYSSHPNFLIKFMPTSEPQYPNQLNLAWPCSSFNSHLTLGVFGVGTEPGAIAVRPRSRSPARVPGRPRWRTEPPTARIRHFGSVRGWARARVGGGVGCCVRVCECIRSLLSMPQPLSGAPHVALYQSPKKSEIFVQIVPKTTSGSSSG